MSSVHARLRNLSQMEFYKVAREIRLGTANWVFSEFGQKRKPKSLTVAIKSITPEDYHAVMDVLAKYGVVTGSEVIYQYPLEWIESEKEAILSWGRELVSVISQANLLDNHKNPRKWHKREMLQERAISICVDFYTELDILMSLFPQRLDKYQRLLDLLGKEIELIRGWQRSDIKKRRAMREKRKDPG